MPSTYTTNLGIEKIATGEQSGIWGTTSNTNFDLIDEAVNGVEQVTLAAAGSSGSPNDLPITEGASSDGRNKFIEFIDAGDLGATAFVQLTPNDAEKVVHIRNSLSANRTITIFQGTYNASNDFVIPNGADVVLKFDGAGSGAVVSDVFVNLTPTKLTTAEADVTTVNATTVDTTNIEVTNIKAKDGTSAGSIADSSGVVTLASAVLTTADINGGTIDNSTIATSNITVGAGKTLNVSAGTLTLANDQISGDKIQGGTIGSTTITTLTSTTGNITTVNATTVTASGNLTVNGNTTLGNAATDTVTITADVASDLIPSVDGSFDLGASGAEWQDLFIDGTANIDSLVADTADINGGTIDNSTIATSNITVGAGKTLDVSAGTLTLANDQISGDKIQGGTIASTTITTLTSTTGNITTVNATTVDSTNVEVTNIKAKDGTASATIANSTGVMTIASAVLTTADINGGTADNVTIGGGTAAAGTFTTLTATGNVVLGDAATDTVTVTADVASSLIPSADNTYDLGAAASEWRNLYIDGTANLDTVSAGTITASGNLTVNGNTTLGNAATDTVTITADVASDLIPSVDGSFDLGASGAEWQDLFIDGTANIDSLVADTADINGGTIDGTVIGGATPAAGTFTTLTANGNVVLGDAATDTVTVTADVASSLIPSADNTYDLGGVGAEWRNLYIDGTANIDSLVANTADINGGTIDGVTIGGASAGAGTFTSLSDSGNLTFTGTGNRITGDFSNATIANRVAFQTTTTNGPTSVSLLPNGTSQVTNFRAFNTADPTNSAFQSIAALSTEARVESGITGTGTYLPMAFYTGGSERIRIDSGGNVGIGTTSPVGKLDVNNAIYARPGTTALASEVKATASDYLSAPSFTNTGPKQFGSTASGTTVGLSNASLGLLEFINCSAGLIYTNGGAPIVFGTSSTERMRIDSSGAVSIVGSLSKGSGSFKIDHPIKPDTHHLVHSFIEGPQADNIYRGKIDLINGIATINIDVVAGMTEGTFDALNREVQCFTSNESGWTAVRGSVSGNILTIEAQDNTCIDTISWMVIGERKDQHMYDTEWTDENGKVIVEPEKVTEDTEESE